MLRAPLNEVADAPEPHGVDAVRLRPDPEAQFDQCRLVRTLRVWSGAEERELLPVDRSGAR